MSAKEPRVHVMQERGRAGSVATYRRRRCAVALAVEEQARTAAAAPLAPWLAGDASALPRRPPGAA